MTRLCPRDGHPMTMDTQIAYDSRGTLLRFCCTYCSRDIIIKADGTQVSREAEKRYSDPQPYTKRPGIKLSLADKHYEELKPRWDNGLCGCGCGNKLSDPRARWYREHGKTWRRKILKTQGELEEIDVP